MKRTFYNRNTHFDSNYRNVQAELWQLLTDEQRKRIAIVFCHLKNHSQIEISEAIIDFLEEGIMPEPCDWSDIFNAIQFNYILYRVFGVEIEKILGKKPSTH